MNESVASAVMEGEESFFTREKILVLLRLYKIYKQKVGRGEIKTMKRMWEKIATDLSTQFKITISASKCENKFRVLERAYKKNKDHSNRTGRGRKDFAYEEEFDELNFKKVNTAPKFLLSNKIIHSTDPSTIEVCAAPNTSSPSAIPSKSSLRTTSTMSPIHAPSTSMYEPTGMMKEESINIHYPIIQIEEGTREVPVRRRRKPTSSVTKVTDILIEMKNKFLEYYDKKIELEKEKIKIQREKLEEDKKRTIILEKLLKQKINL